MAERIGFIGLGRMGRSMALNLQRKGFRLTVHDRVQAPVDALVEAGATAADDAAAVGAASTIVFTMLPNSPDVSAVAEALATTMAPGGLLVDMSTIDPLASTRIAERLAERGIRFVDAPVGRLAVHADRGESLFMVGAAPDDLERIRPMLNAMGTSIIPCGPVGAGIRTKLVNNFLAIALAQLDAEVLALSHRLGIDTQTMIDVINGTSATNGYLNMAYVPKGLKGDTSPGFQIDLAHKDMSLAVAAAHDLKMPLALGTMVREILVMARARGYGGQDCTALLDHWCAQAGIDPPRLP